jgi:hypothetical protein
MTNHYFSFRSFFLIPKQAERSKSFLCFGSSWIHVPVRVLLHTLLFLCFGTCWIHVPARVLLHTLLFLCFGTCWIHVPARVPLHTLLFLCFGTCWIHVPARVLLLRMEDFGPPGKPGGPHFTRAHQGAHVFTRGPIVIA